MLKSALGGAYEDEWPIQYLWHLSDEGAHNAVELQEGINRELDDLEALVYALWSDQ